MSAHRSAQEQRWVIGGVVVALLVAVLGWILLVSPQRAETDSVNGQAADVRNDNLSWQAKISTLQSESKDMSTVTKALGLAQQALPSTSGVPNFLRSLQALGSRTGTDVVSLTVGAPTDVSTVATGSNGSNAGNGSTATASPTTAAPGAPTGSGVYALTITAQVNGASDKLDAFLRKLQTEQPRAVLITHLVRGSAQDGATSLQLTMQAFVAPSGAAEQARLAQAAGR